MYPTFDILFAVEGLECSTKINAANWEFALEKFWETFDGLEVEVLSINGEEPHEWND